MRDKTKGLLDGDRLAHARDEYDERKLAYRPGLGEAVDGFTEAFVDRLDAQRETELKNADVTALAADAVDWFERHRRLPPDRYEYFTFEACCDGVSLYFHSHIDFEGEFRVRDVFFDAQTKGGQAAIGSKTPEELLTALGGGLDNPDFAVMLDVFRAGIAIISSPDHIPAPIRGE